jgi:curved DNA-binding protein CbpA
MISMMRTESLGRLRVPDPSPLDVHTADAQGQSRADSQEPLRFNDEVDYYDRLGVLPSAEDVLIRASYRALDLGRQRAGTVSDEMQLRAQELGEAYAVLSNLQSRREYDELRHAGARLGKFIPDDDQVRATYEAAAAVYDERWATAVEYYPDIAGLRAKLGQTSCRLAFAFQVLALEKKQFNQRVEVAKQLHDDFLKIYFGENPRIVLFARLLIALGEWEAAIDLNRAISVLGSDIDAKLIVDRVEQKFSLADARPFHANAKTIFEQAKAVVTRPRRGLESALFERLGGRVTRECLERNVFGWPREIQVTAALWGEQIAFASPADFYTWIREDVAPEALTLVKKMDLIEPELRF